ncbi:tyrosine--tRNA ligase [Mycoplasma phocoeninasale]|uniref:Tyrosine--tRNA ligase n=1 Tax=Mycoplasma phocoeninasale TaxID=2726117 RepID=A0A858U7A0_9MOLU|nr:tyrosine--tRNA ligase [Mycoplasma phocoeninasale]MBN0970749.1 tyrosine--tRNA ligase [Mycoplasma phocoeninasale]QJG66606.1 tyrosine--tRNA ligase [Mycoplasma phocoeninasale]
MEKDILIDLKNRKIFNNISSEEKFYKLPKNSAVYSGFDPTAKSLHLGNYIQIVSLLRFKKYNFNPIAIIGGITGMIGDPSFRNSEREFLDSKVLEENKAAVKKQLESFGLKVIDNYDFYRNWTLVDFLTKIGKLINVNYLLEKESIATRLASGLSFTEFSYQLIQGWDFKTLFEQNNVKIQLGGSDQWGNITTGLEIIRKIHGENANALAITTNLLVDENGIKFGKSTGGGSLWLDKNMTSPYAIYQFLLNQGDNKIEEYLKWLTFLEISEIDNIMTQHNFDRKQRIAQKSLAYEVVKDIHSEEIAKHCIQISEALFSKNADLGMTDIEMLLGFLKVYEVPSNQEKFIDFIKFSGISSSNREIREFIAKKSFEIDGKVIEDENEIIIFKKYNKKYALLKKGKKEFIILKNNLDK